MTVVGGGAAAAGEENMRWGRARDANRDRHTLVRLWYPLGACLPLHDDGDEFSIDSETQRRPAN